MGRVVVYGAQWCGDCRRSLALLERVGVAYEYIDLERTPERTGEAVRLGGSRRIPVIVLPGDRVLVEPTDQELESALAGISR